MARSAADCSLSPLLRLLNSQGEVVGEGKEAEHGYQTQRAKPLEIAPESWSLAWNQTCTPEAPGGIGTSHVAVPTGLAILWSKMVMGWLSRMVPKGELIGPPPVSE